MIELSKAKSMFVAMLVVGIWIAVLCSAPQELANFLWRRIGITTDLPLRHLLQVILNSAAVIAFLVFTKRAALLVPRRPESPTVLLLFIPLVALNLARGPLVDAGAAFLLVVCVSAMLTGFWEEFLFRGLIQDRLAVMGPRLSLVVTALLFGLIHAYAGFWKVAIAFCIGLAFSLARDHVGMWPLVVMHGGIDIFAGILQRRWRDHSLFALIVVGAYGVVCLILLMRRGNRAPEGLAARS